MEARFGSLDGRVDSLDEQMRSMNQRLDAMLRLQEEPVRGGRERTAATLPRREARSLLEATEESVEVGGATNAGTRGEIRWRRLEMPMFDGENPDGWILKAERFFNHNRLSDVEMVEAAVINFEGDALLWFQWENKKREIDSWGELKKLVLRQFRSIHSGSLYEQWLALRQEVSVGDYRRRFIELSAPLERVSEEVALGQYINGLSPEIRVELRLFEPNT